MNRYFDRMQRAAMLMVVIITVPFVYGLGVEWVTQNRSLTMWLAVAIFSPLAMFALRVIEVYGSENRTPIEMFNPSKQSWAFMFGDPLLLGYAMMALTRGRQGVPGFGPHWDMLSLAFGIAVSIAFRVVDKQRYVKAGVRDALSSPTKVWHDFAVFPVVLSLLIYAGVPQLKYGWSFHTVVGLLCVLGFLGLCVADALRDKRGTLKPADQHFGYDPFGLRLAMS